MLKRWNESGKFQMRIWLIVVTVESANLKKETWRRLRTLPSKKASSRSGLPEYSNIRQLHWKTCASKQSFPGTKYGSCTEALNRYSTFLESPILLSATSTRKGKEKKSFNFWGNGGPIDKIVEMVNGTGGEIALLFGFIPSEINWKNIFWVFTVWFVDLPKSFQILEVVKSNINLELISLWKIAELPSLIISCKSKMSRKDFTVFLRLGISISGHPRKSSVKIIAPTIRLKRRIRKSDYWWPDLGLNRNADSASFRKFSERKIVRR